MRLELPEVPHGTETLLAVALGAVLATIGGFIATLLEARLRRGDRQRTAALTFGEVMSSLALLVKAAQDAHGHGDPFGTVTMRLLRAARREVEAYERSRPALPDLNDADLRLAVHAVMSRMALALDGVIDDARNDAEREQAYGYLLSIAPNLDPLVRRLVPLAGQPITPYEALSHAAELGGG
jgi:hypothetical protein